MADNYFTVADIYGLLENGYKPGVRENITYLLLGDPGIGKTQIVRKFAKDKGVNVVTLLCSQQLPNEIVGTTAPDINGGTDDQKYYKPSWLLHLHDGDILFLDEMLTAPKSVLAAMLTMVESRILQNDAVLPDVMIVAAANPPGSPSIVDPAIRDRFQIVELRNENITSAEYLAKKYGGSREALSRILTYRKGCENVWNQITPRTVEKMIIQAEATCDKTQELDAKFLIKMYGAAPYSALKEWWDSRADQIRNKKFFEHVNQQKEQSFDAIKEQLKAAVKAASYENPNAIGHITVHKSSVPGEFIEEHIPDCIKGDDVLYLKKAMRECLWFGQDIEDACEEVTAEYNNTIVDAEVDKMFEENDISTIIGTLEKTPIWDNIKSILDSIVLVDVNMEGEA